MFLIKNFIKTLSTFLILICFSACGLFAQSYNNQVVVIESRAKPGKAIDVKWAETQNGTNVWLYEKNNSNAQKFRLKSAGGGFYYIESLLKSNMVLDVSNGETADNTNIWLHEKNGSRAQKFKIKKSKSGVVIFVSALAPKHFIGLSDNYENIVLRKGFAGNKRTGFFLRKDPRNRTIDVNVKLWTPGHKVIDKPTSVVIGDVIKPGADISDEVLSTIEDFSSLLELAGPKGEAAAIIVENAMKLGKFIMKWVIKIRVKNQMSITIWNGANNTRINVTDMKPLKNYIVEVEDKLLDTEGNQLDMSRAKGATAYTDKDRMGAILLPIYPKGRLGVGVIIDFEVYDLKDKGSPAKKYQLWIENKFGKRKSTYVVAETTFGLPIMGPVYSDEKNIESKITTDGKFKMHLNVKKDSENPKEEHLELRFTRAK